MFEIEEITVPAGYTGAGSVTAITRNDGKAAQQTDGFTAGYGQNAEITITNSLGDVLPETGGVGTTMFYVVGGLMVAAAAVLLVLKKRAV